MGAPSSSPRSLDRLRTLDDLPDTTTQLREARQLCNHGARAEMILKWLLGRLKSSVEARKLSDSWDLIGLCVRLLPAQRLASLLAGSGFVDVLQAAWEKAELDETAMLSLSRLLNLLFELGRSADGMAIQSLLSISSSTAASMCGKWCEHGYALLNHQQEVRSTGLEHELLSPVVRLWTSRRRSGSDDELFNAECLVPFSLVLALLSKTFPPISRKRKRENHDEKDVLEHVKSVETLIAKHTILPSKQALTATQDSKDRRSWSRKSVANGPSIKETLAKFKQTIWSGTSEHSLEALTRILEIALRSVSTYTSKQRTKERPFIETLFSAMRDCFANQPLELKSQTLTAMLGTLLDHNFPLSPAFSKELVRELVQVQTSSDGHTAQLTFDWPLLSVALELSPDIFNDPSIVEPIFDAITLEQGQGQDAKHRTKSAPPQDLAATLRNRIVVPMMDAHAASRNLSAFVDSWYKQLLRAQNWSVWTIWSDLGAHFGEVADGSLTNDQMMQLFDQYASSVIEAAATPEVVKRRETHLELGASFTLLSAILLGTKSEALSLRIHAELGALLRALYTLGEHEELIGTDSIAAEFWQLLRQVCQLWYPAWAAQIGTRAAIASEGESLMSCPTFEAALSQCEVKLELSITKRTAHFARAFVTAVCNLFEPYQENERCAQLCGAALETLALKQNTSVDSFIRYPKLLLKLHPSTLSNVFSMLLRSGHGECLQAIVTALQSSEACTALEILIETAAEHLNQMCAGQYSTSRELTVFSILGSINAASFKSDKSSQRKLLDAISNLPAPQADEHYAGQLQRRLAVILSLLALPCRDALLLNSADSVWNLAGIFSPKVSSSALDDMRSLQLFEEVVKAILSEWLGWHGKVQNENMLPEFYRRTMDLMGASCRGIDGRYITKASHLVMIKAALDMLRKARAGFPQAIFPDAEPMQRYMGTLLQESEALASTDTPPITLDSRKRLHLRLRLNALIALGPSGLRLSGMDEEEFSERITHLATIILVNNRAANDGDSIPLASSCFQLISRYGKKSVGDLRDVARRALLATTTAPDHTTILTAWHQAVSNADAEERLEALREQIHSTETHTPSELVLLQTLISSMSKDELEGTNDFSGIQIVQPILNVAREAATLHTCRTALQILATIAKQKPFMLNQHGIEQTIATIRTLLTTSTHLAAIFPDLCNLLTALFSHHRTRLQGRYHLLIALFQAFVSALFHESKASTPPETVIRHARALVRLLESFCHPPQPRHRGKTSELVDEARKAQAQTGQYVQYVLHHYCAQVLTGALVGGVREAFMPGVWAMIEAIEANNSDGIKVLSAAMNNSERAVLRSVYDDWKRFGKWEGL